jgi:hypothetical protein
MNILARIVKLFKRQPVNSDTIGWLDYSARLGYLPPRLAGKKW